MIETPSRIELLIFEDAIPRVLAELVGEIQAESATLGAGRHPEAAAELADLVRVMNCYYSNLIEGHNTRPRDIERALAGAEVEPERRPLALEARAHVLVHRRIAALEAALAALEAALAALEAALAALEAAVDALEAAVDALEAAVDALEAAVDALEYSSDGTTSGRDCQAQGYPTEKSAVIQYDTGGLKGGFQSPSDRWE